MSLLSRLAVQAARAYGILSARSTNVSADYLVVAGGGGAVQGGGGGGGLLTSTFTLSTLNTYSITVGAGGPNTGATNVRAGSNSVVSGTGLSTVTATGGGYGGGGSFQAGSGGSGGGGSNDAPSTGGTGTSGQGNNGGNGASTYGGGGGGAGAAGSNQNGGNGSASSISGSSVTYAGGGGGGSSATPGTGGTGGGAAGTNASPAGSGTANTGGGGGGSWASTNGAGGSGIVIISYTSATPKFVGGTITTSGGKQIHTFTSSGTLSPITPVTASYLVVAGGGGAGAALGGGGGAGGLLTSSTTLYSGATYVVTVGAGGSGGVGTATSATNGSNSILSGTGITTVTTTGGGKGGNGNTNNGTGPAGNGGSGGGGGGGNSNSFVGGTGTSGQGYAGGNNYTSPNYGAGGGGGSSAVGTNATGSTSGNGGAGTASSITGSSVTYAGGGGGGGSASITLGSGGTGGGGSGGANGVVGTAGTANTGGGGGGGGESGSANGGAGGSGIVIISYAGSQQFNGGLVTTSGGNTIHTFTSTGALTPLTNNLNNSLRFRSSATAYLSRTPTLAGNRNTWTFSAWVKKTPLASGVQAMIAAGVSTTVYDDFCFENDQIRFVFNNGTYDVKTTQVFRDPSAWYHIVVAMDTTQATAANRTKIYVNGNQVTAFATANYPAQNHNTNINNTILNTIGNLYNGSFSSYFDGYMTDINFIDGQALEPYYFGNNDANGVWKPILYKGTYGTNGFYLTFGNTTSTTTLGYDSSPNGNNWTTNNISLTAGTTYDAMTDVPTNTSATVANYCVLNPLNKDTSITVTNANLSASAGGTNIGVTGSIAISSGKWYWEVTQTAGGVATSNIVGITDATLSAKTAGLTTNSYGYGTGTTAYKWNAGTNTAYGVNWTNGDVIGVAFDADAGSLTFYKNGSSQGTAFTGISGTFYPAFGFQNTSAYDINFGQRPFTYTPPTGYVALNTYNLPTPTILQGNKYMDATLYTGNGASSNTAVNAGQFKPDFVWIKSRVNNPSGGALNHVLTDSVRGVTKELNSNNTGAEGTNSAGLTAFNSNGFTVGGDYNYNNPGNGGAMVGWQWQAGQGTNTTNTAGSITSTVSVNTTAGFSIVLYTGNGGAMTVGHGLGVAPKMIILKDRDIGRPWPVYHGSLATNQYLMLNTTAAAATSTQYWNNTAPTSTVFSVNGIEGNVGANGEKYVAYCWAEIAGFSKFGSYTGNGSADGPFIYTGFRPKFVMTKKTDTISNWSIHDSSRATYNLTINELYPDTSDAEYTGTSDSFDFLSNGFKPRAAGTPTNASGGTYIFMAFAEHPAKISNAR